MWFKKGKDTSDTEDINSLDYSGDRLLHGFDIDYWNFLGTTEMNFVDGDPNGKNKVLQSAQVFFFQKAVYGPSGSDVGVREYVIVPIGGKNPNGLNFKKDHLWGIKYLPLWKLGEYPYYNLIRDPSVYLKNRMFLEYKATYDYSTNEWKQKGSTVTKNVVQNKQVLEEKDNVVKVDFNKKDDDK